MTTTNALDDGFDEAERGLEWLEKLEALRARSASDQAALEVAEYVMKLRAAVFALAGNRASEELKETAGMETAQLVDELRQEGDNDRWHSRIRPALLKTES
jgi:hypothetical protein